MKGKFDGIARTGKIEQGSGEVRVGAVLLPVSKRKPWWVVADCVAGVGSSCDPPRCV